MTEAQETAALIRDLQRRCEAGAAFIRYYHKNPEELRNWAKRIESNWAPNAVCIPAMSLEQGAEEAAKWLREQA